MTRTAIGKYGIVDNEGVDVGYFEAGVGPLVILCHGFPGLSYSWRHQVRALAIEGFRAVAMDMRGYGSSGKPGATSNYSLDHIRSDILSLLNHLGEERAIFIGHDFGTPVVWNMALECPDRVAGIIALSVPYDFDYYGRRGIGHSGDSYDETTPSEQFAAYAQSSFLHAHYFQQRGPADEELEGNTATFLRRIYWSLSGEGNLLEGFSRAEPGSGYLDVLPEPSKPLPWPWLDEQAMDHYVRAYMSSGFSGALNWYRVADLNWELNRRYLGMRIDVPALFLAGERDAVIAMSGPESFDFMRQMVTDLKGIVMAPEAGHWVQQESAELVNRSILEFTRIVYGRPSPGRRQI